MTYSPLITLRSPQLNHLHSGKVRDSFRVNSTTRMIVTTDRISAFDRVLNNAIPNKGAILTGLAAAWFEKTRHIVDNHFVEAIDPNVMIVKEAKPLRVEVIVRGYLTGSMWRGYEKGERNFSGINVPDGLEKESKFDQPIITPTTKESIDVPITPKSIVERGLVDEKIWNEIENKARELFAFGSELCEQKGLTLVDTKYEFGLVDGKLILIDEIHTPDSSRFWDKDNPGQWMDKEYIRQWLISNGDKEIESLPEEVIEEAVERYSLVYSRLLDTPAPSCTMNPHQRIYHSLVAKGLIKEGYIAVICASPKDGEHVKKICKALKPYDIFIDLRMVSAHKNGEKILDMANLYNSSIEPGCAIAIAGRSNGLGGALAANFAIAVINCPPFKDDADLMLNIGSSLMMPSNAPAGTCVGPTLAAQLSLRSLNLPRLKEQFRIEIANTKQELEDYDNKLRDYSLEEATI